VELKLTQIQGVFDSKFRVVVLIGLDDSGTVWYKQLHEDYWTAESMSYINPAKEA
jgi:hypothetical protein